MNKRDTIFTTEMYIFAEMLQIVPLEGGIKADIFELIVVKQIVKNILFQTCAEQPGETKDRVRWELCADKLFQLSAVCTIRVGCVVGTVFCLGVCTIEYINRGNEHKMIAANGGEEFAEESEEASIFGRRLIDSPLFGRHCAKIERIVGFVAKSLNISRVIEI